MYAVLFQLSSVLLILTPTYSVLAQDIPVLDSVGGAYVPVNVYIVASAVWQFHNDKKSISVCWEDTSESNSIDRELVKLAVTQQWQSNSAVLFIGWEECATENPGIRIRVADEQPRVKRLGSYLDGLKDGMVLNFSFHNWSPSCGSSKKEREFCIYANAVHEFGHALAFAHKEERFFGPGGCFLAKSSDTNSVMNYCNVQYNNGGILSAADKVAVQKLYGSPK
jgi:hypothetical protein